MIHFTFKNVVFFEKIEKVKLTENHSRISLIQKKNYFLIFRIRIEYIHIFCSESSDQFLVEKIDH